MNSDPQADIFSGPVRDHEAPDGGQQVQRHRRDFAGVLRSVPHGQAGHHHVSVTYCLNLKYKMVLDKLFKDTFFYIFPASAF